MKWKTIGLLFDLVQWRLTCIVSGSSGIWVKLVMHSVIAIYSSYHYDHFGYFLIVLWLGPGDWSLSRSSSDVTIACPGHPGAGGGVGLVNRVGRFVTADVREGPGSETGVLFHRQHCSLFLFLNCDPLGLCCSFSFPLTYTVRPTWDLRRTCCCLVWYTETLTCDFTPGIAAPRPEPSVHSITGPWRQFRKRRPRRESRKRRQRRESQKRRFWRES